MRDRPLREYQAAANAAVRREWEAVRSVLLVAPTGSGKTRIGLELVSGYQCVLWSAHRRELVIQARDVLVGAYGRAAVGVIMPGEHATPRAQFQVGTVQTLLARGTPGDVDLVVLDEAHHYMADEWRELAEQFPGAKCLGLTATPQRQDGEALGDMFDAMVVAASYSQLIAGGFLVPTFVLQPPKQLGSDLAMDPVSAWVKHSGGALTFAFCARVDAAYGLAQRFRDAGIRAATIEAGTSKRERDETMAQFRAGRVRVLTSVAALTEGVDVPEAGCALLAKNFGHASGYLQAVGRVLRPAEGKQEAIVIDLCGSTLRFGMPTDDRVYSLQGRAISGVGPGPGDCERGEFSQEIRGLELRVAAAGAAKLPPAPVVVAPVDDAERRAEFRRLLELARKHRMRDGFAAVKYREKFGEEPRREWM